MLSKHFLPEIDPEVLKGGRVQLVVSYFSHNKHI